MAAVVPFIPLIAAGVSVIGGMMNRPDTPKQYAPQVSTPTVMPTEDSEATLAAKRQALLAQQSRGGRASTILSDNSDNQTLGGN